MMHCRVDRAMCLRLMVAVDNLSAHWRKVVVVVPVGTPGCSDRRFDHDCMNRTVGGHQWMHDCGSPELGHVPDNCRCTHTRSQDWTMRSHGDCHDGDYFHHCSHYHDLDCLEHEFWSILLPVL